MKKIILILGLFCGGLVLKAQVLLDFRQCRQMALENSREIAIAGKQSEKALFTAKSYHAGFFPRLSGSGLGFYNQEKYSYRIKGGYLPTYVPDQQGNLQPNLVVDPATGKPVLGADGSFVFKEYAFLPDISLKLGLRGVYLVGIQLEQPLYMGGKVRAAYEMARVGETIATENIRLNRSNVIEAADKAYWQLLEVQEQLKAAKAYRSTVQELLREVENARETGMVMGNEVLKVEVRFNEADLMVQKAENGRVLSQMNLCRIVGLNLHTDVYIADSLSGEITHGVMQQQAMISQRPDYNLLAQEVELRKKEIRLTKADYLPQVGLTAGYGYGGGLELNGERESKASFNAMAAVEIPIFTWGEGRNKIKAAVLEQEVSRLNLEKSAQLMELEVTAARFNIQDAQTRVKMARNALLQANENLRISKDQYEVGLETLTNLLEAQAQWQKAWSQWVEAKAQLHLSETEYLKSIGKLDE